MSTLQLVVFLGQFLLNLPIAWFVMMGTGGADILSVVGVGIESASPPSTTRGVTMLAFIFLVFFHYLWTFGIRGLSAKLTMGFDTSVMTFSFVLFLQVSTGVVAWLYPMPDALVGVAVVLFAVGISISMLADEQLRSFAHAKAAPGYTGPRVMRTGMRAWSRHPNFIGFVLYWTCGVALLSGALWMPLVWMGIFGVFILLQVIPAHEHHMASKYGAEWAEYVAATPILFPLLPKTRSARVSME